MDPQWDIGDKLASVGGRGGGHEEPMIGNSQWQRLNDVLENDVGCLPGVSWLIYSYVVDGITLAESTPL